MTDNVNRNMSMNSSMKASLRIRCIPCGQLMPVVGEGYHYQQHDHDDINNVRNAATGFGTDVHSNAISDLVFDASIDVVHPNKALALTGGTSTGTSSCAKIVARMSDEPDVRFALVTARYLKNRMDQSSSLGKDLLKAITIHDMKAIYALLQQGADPNFTEQLCWHDETTKLVHHCWHPDGTPFLCPPFDPLKEERPHQPTQPLSHICHDFFKLGITHQCYHQLLADIAEILIQHGARITQADMWYITNSPNNPTLFYQNNPNIIIPMFDLPSKNVYSVVTAAREAIEGLHALCQVYPIFDFATYLRTQHEHENKHHSLKETNSADSDSDGESEHDDDSDANTPASAYTIHVTDKLIRASPALLPYYTAFVYQSACKRFASQKSVYFGSPHKQTRQRGPSRTKKLVLPALPPQIEAQIRAMAMDVHHENFSATSIPDPIVSQTQ
ncbi:expressed unknown protein [Seminavis robusta]|uniref:Uncharacterized protein n=1 Tax=Seminavis robusta TaxID=568900 RepID=A0A9N8HY78_9STRA|nr:expressed unknown protein [Seminavis robusta]|eukprot:Sro2408_g326620.1 n/a (444) ;mRNA; f:2531-3862